jgi:hypothetical protein
MTVSSGEDDARFVRRGVTHRALSVYQERSPDSPGCVKAPAPIT